MFESQYEKQFERFFTSLLNRSLSCFDRDVLRSAKNEIRKSYFAEFRKLK